MKKLLILALLAIAFLFYIASDSKSGLRDGKDISVVHSKEGRLKAFVREVNIDGSIMVSQWYQLVVEDELGEKRIVLTADNTQGLVIQWLQDNKLWVCYGEGTRISSFYNNVGFYYENSPHLNAEVILKRGATFTDCKEALNVVEQNPLSGLLLSETVAYNFVY